MSIRKILKDEMQLRDVDELIEIIKNLYNIKDFSTRSYYVGLINKYFKFIPKIIITEKFIPKF